MNDKKIDRLLAVIACALAALIWSVRVIIEVVHQLYNESVFLLCVDVLCAVIWIVAFAIQLRKYRLGQKD